MVYVMFVVTVCGDCVVFVVTVCGVCGDCVCGDSVW